ncbi:MAG TPA: choice-of-anchor R domain-containing protein [Phycisphaerae bacterium]|nr:choice-of-anchor R domain-containing protein [Phycisphaerae bacterium]HRW51843.1 choice-of-anchor R domain-containing protein [Phycisphaerae bacterium]
MNRSLVWAMATVMMSFGPSTFGDVIVLTDNLSEPTGGVESASDTVTFAVSFLTDDSMRQLSSVTLHMGNPSQSGTATLHVYEDGGLEPGAYVGTLTPPQTYASDPAETTFGGGAIPLAADRLYWLVLETSGGTFTWSFSESNAGSGDGFTNEWGTSPDAGAAWWTNDSFCLQFRAVASTECACPADINGDTRVDGADIHAFTQCVIGDEGSCLCADLDGVDGIDANDLALFVADLLGGATCE